MLRVEFHCHTHYSKDSLLTPAGLLAACRRKGLDRVIITDHNQVRGAQLAQQLDPQRVIVGEEIMTSQGEILAAFVKERIPPHLEPEQAIALLRDQGAFISLAHPFDSRRSGAWDLPDLVRITPLVDAIEVFNARCLGGEPNRQAQEYAAQHDLCGTAGSDAHTAWELGRATLLLPDFDGPDGLRQAICNAQIQGVISPGWVLFASFSARMWKLMRKRVIPNQ